MHQRIVSVGPSDPRSFPPQIPGRPAPETKSTAGDGPSPAHPAPTACLPVSPRVACAVVRQLVTEVAALCCERPLLRRDARRQTCHTRQVAMYVCHVVLQLSLSDIGLAFGRDRTTAGHACGVVEDRRDDPAFDAFVAGVERIVTAVFGPTGIGSHG